MIQLKRITVFALLILLHLAGAEENTAWGSNFLTYSDYSLFDEGNYEEYLLIVMPVDTPPPDPYFGNGDPTTDPYDNNPFNLSPPTNVETDFEMTEDGDGFYIHERVGGIDISPPSYISNEDYITWRKNNSIRDHWRSRAAGSTEAVSNSALAPKFAVNSEAFKDIFGGGSVEIRPNGTALLDLGAEFNRNQNPSLPIRQQRTANFKFDQNIQLNVVGKIGEKLRLNANWDTQATFDFENQLKLEFTGTEDEILQKIEAGNVSLPLTSSLIQGGQNLFGIKVALKFGPLMVTAIASQQKGKTQSIKAPGGAQETPFRKKAIDYDENRHFFISHWFRSQYERALQTRPVVNAPITITRVEAWITNNNSSSTTDNRNAVGFVDLGETEQVPNPGFPFEQGVVFNDTLTTFSSYPDNNANVLKNGLESDPVYSEKSTVDDALINNFGLENGIDFVKVENMRKLNPNEFKFHQQLGYVSLNSPLQANQVLFVAYEYMLGGNVYQVGDFSLDNGKQANELNSNVLFLKMLKPAQVRPLYNGDPFPTWDLMMKNIYNIGGYGITANNFRFEIMFDSRTSAGDIPLLPTGPQKNVPLLQVFGMDTIQNNNQAGPDGIFDFLTDITIQPDKGLIIFPVLEPFGSHLERKLEYDEEEIDKYVFKEMYTSTKQDALNYATDKDRYYVQGTYQGSSSSEIALNSINVAPGSVRVTANGILLNEGIDYQVDYNIGKVTILNQGILTSGQEIKVDFETVTLFGIETKTLVGTRFDYVVSQDVQFGATVLHLNERPLTNKVNIGDEPLSNLIWGVDGTVRKDSRFITKLVDKIPLIQTNEISTFNAAGEFAMLVPGHPKAIEVNGEEGIAYVDDFESAKTTFDLTGFRAWNFASFPGDNGYNDLYEPGPGWNDTLSPGFSRAKLAWYSIDPSFYYGSNNEDFPEADLSNHYTRQVTPTEVFPNQTNITGDNLQRTFDLHFLPAERGPYNYEVDGNVFDSTGKFIDPTLSWAGIQRRTSGNTDFEAANFEFIEFWMMDPFIDSTGTRNFDGGEFYLDLGQISEDVVKDNNRNFENGLPADPADTNSYSVSPWGRYPNTTPPTNSFNNEPDAREFQDVGLDGLRNIDEQSFFQAYLDQLEAIHGANSQIYGQANADPSGDNYLYFRGDNWNGQGILDRYLPFNGQEGNTPLNATQNGFSTQGSPNPDTEDLNLNGTLNSNEEYYEYKMDFRPSEMEIGKNFIVDIIPSEIRLVNGQTDNVNWYQFRIPLQAGVPINNIQNFKAIEFVRMYLKGWNEEVVLRFARLQLVSTTWRTFRDYLGVESDTLVPDPDPSSSFEIGTVNVEQNGNRQPFNYILPPGIIRQQQVSSPQPGLLQNEQALVMRACGLDDGDARGAFKLTNFDMRSYQRLKMWVHAENIVGSGQDFEPGELRAFVRLGSDTRSNYYEYEIPLSPSVFGSQDTANIWSNEFDIDLLSLPDIKALRNAANWPVINRFLYEDPSGTLIPETDRVYIVGTPKLSEVKTIMVGIRNENDGQGDICAEVWMNEMRLVDFNENSGWAANARASIKLADFATISASGSYMTPGFGSIEQRINNRTRETTAIWDVTGNFNMGKFFPKEWGIQLPLYVTYGERTITPQYNPLEADVLMTNFMNTLEESVKDTILDALIDRRVNKSISLNNIRKVKVPKKGAKPTDKDRTFPWAIENFTLSASYNEVLHTNHRILKNVQRNHRASLAYSYNFNPKPIEPFKKAKKKNLITAFNFYVLPKTFTMTVAGDRRYEENIIRPTANGIPIRPTYQKNFSLTRNYNLRWDLTKSLSLNYSANNTGRVDEPFGELTETNQDSLWENLLSFGSQVNDTTGLYQLGKDKRVNFGRNLRFNQNLGLNYVLPFDQFNLTNWISGSGSYQGGYNWTAAPDNNLALGNQVSNTQTVQGNVRLNFESLYNKIGFLRKILEDEPKGRETAPKPRRPVTEPNPPEEEVAAEDSTEKGPSIFKKIGKQLGRLLMSVKSVNLDYNRNMSTGIAGYTPQTDNFGLDFNHRFNDAQTGQLTNSPLTAPGLPYVFGWQENSINELDNPNNFLDQWGENGWISSNPNLVTPFNATWTENLSPRVAITLLKDFKIDLNASRTASQNYSEIFSFDPVTEEWVHNNRLFNGQYSTSYIFIGTAFEKNIAASASFVAMEDIRDDISNELADRNPFYDQFLNSAGINPAQAVRDSFAQGYSPTSQEVLIPAFRLAYGAGKFKEGGDLSAFPAIPLPNWNINYNGLGKIEALKKTFRSVTIRHGYRGTYNVGGFTQNVRYTGNDDGFSSEYFPAEILAPNDTFYNVESQYVVPSVSFSESFAPLAGVNMKFVNGLSANVDLKMSRNVNLSMTNIQLTEQRTKDFTIGLAYRKDKFEKTFQLFGRTINMQNQLNSRLDITLRDSKTRNRRLDNAANSEITGGNFQLIVKPSIDYVVNTKVNVRFYIEHNRNRPAISTSFPSSYTAVGFQVRFTLAN